MAENQIEVRLFVGDQVFEMTGLNVNQSHSDLARTVGVTGFVANADLERLSTALKAAGYKQARMSDNGFSTQISLSRPADKSSILSLFK